eukprot:CAMPEP_0117615448 /NCGR_PEP_ID=MMETSP0784-20121206/84545_1 /TAXON_ID=39447 /ORGANISM="" /LENGTH=620 /DNA_ID=CAMNT_0005419185 /DNA_START=34 /DNA_END=1896 /DNA_ORIENTATION=-
MPLAMLRGGLAADVLRATSPGGSEVAAIAPELADAAGPSDPRGFGSGSSAAVPGFVAAGDFAQASAAAEEDNAKEVERCEKLMAVMDRRKVERPDAAMVRSDGMALSLEEGSRSKRAEPVAKTTEKGNDMASTDACRANCEAAVILDAMCTGSVQGEAQTARDACGGALDDPSSEDAERRANMEDRAEDCAEQGGDIEHRGGAECVAIEDFTPDEVADLTAEELSQVLCAVSAGVIENLIPEEIGWLGEDEKSRLDAAELIAMDEEHDEDLEHLASNAEGSKELVRVLASERAVGLYDPQPQATERVEGRVERSDETTLSSASAYSMTVEGSRSVAQALVTAASHSEEQTQLPGAGTVAASRLEMVERAEGTLNDIGACAAEMPPEANCFSREHVERLEAAEVSRTQTKADAVEQVDTRRCYDDNGTVWQLETTCDAAVGGEMGQHRWDGADKVAAKTTTEVEDSAILASDTRLGDNAGVSHERCAAQMATEARSSSLENVDRLEMGPEQSPTQSRAEQAVGWRCVDSAAATDVHGSLKPEPVQREEKVLDDGDGIAKGACAAARTFEVERSSHNGVVRPKFDNEPNQACGLQGQNTQIVAEARPLGVENMQGVRASTSD